MHREAAYVVALQAEVEAARHEQDAHALQATRLREEVSVLRKQVATQLY